LTVLTRRTNEDETLQQIRESSLDSLNSTEASGLEKDISTVDDLEAELQKSKRLVLSSKQIEKKVLGESSEEWNPDDDEDVDTSVTTNESQSTETSDDGRKSVHSTFEALLVQMRYEFNEHTIDKAYRTLEAIRQLLKDENVGKEDKADFQARLNSTENLTLVGDIEKLYHDMKKVLKELNDDEGYRLESNKKEYVIKYKNLSEGKVSIKMEATVDVTMTSLLKLFYEPEGYKMWVPFSKETKQLKKISRAGLYMKMKWNLPPPISSREGYMIGAGIERFGENGSFLLMSKTVHDDKQLQERHSLNVPTDSKNVKLDIHYVAVELKPLTEGKTKMSFVGMFDPKIKIIPSHLMGWIVRKGSSFLLNKIVSNAENLDGTNWKAMSTDREFYDWLDNVVQHHFQEKAVQGKN